MDRKNKKLLSYGNDRKDIDGNVRIKIGRRFILVFQIPTDQGSVVI